MMSINRFAFSALAALGSTNHLQAAAAPVTPLAALREFDEVVASTGHDLAVRGVTLCPVRQWQHGIAVHDLSLYPPGARAEAATAFGLDRGPGVLAVAMRSPARAAGLRRDDILLAADGQPLPRAAAGIELSFEPTERILDALDAAFADGVARLTALRGAQRIEVTVRAELGCASRFQVIPSTDFNAKADGRYVQVTSAIVQLAEDEHELAAMIAHEFAHNILRHRARLNAAGIDRAAARVSRHDARLILATEVEADRFSVYLLDRAGYDVAAAPRWWRRLGSRTGGIAATGTHPPWRQRVRQAQQEVSVIQAARQAGGRADPPVRP